MKKSDSSQQTLAMTRKSSDNFDDVSILVFWHCSTVVRILLVIFNFSFFFVFPYQTNCNFSLLIISCTALFIFRINNISLNFMIFRIFFYFCQLRTFLLDIFLLFSRKYYFFLYRFPSHLTENKRNFYFCINFSADSSVIVFLYFIVFRPALAQPHRLCVAELVNIKKIIKINFRFFR